MDLAYRDRGAIGDQDKPSNDGIGADIEIAFAGLPRITSTLIALRSTFASDASWPLLSDLPDSGYIMREGVSLSRFTRLLNVCFYYIFIYSLTPPTPRCSRMH